jgi:large repetitive protein
VCEWDKTTLTQSGCSTNYYWLFWKKNDITNINKIESEFISIVVHEPSYFKLICQTTAGETTDEVLIEPILRPNQPVMVTDKSSYLLGEIAEVSALNCNGHLIWSNGQEGLTQIRVSPTQTTTYTAYCIGKGNCISENSIQVIVKIAPPQVQDAHICFGEHYTLRSGCANGTHAYWTENWFDLDKRIERNEGDRVHLFETKTFAVSCESQAGISEIVLHKVFVHLPIPKPNFQAKDSVIVKGDSLILSAPNCEQKTIWKHTHFQGHTITVKPEASTIYQARCQTDGCLSEEASFRVYVRPKSPTISISADTVCIGNSVQISASTCEDGGKLLWLSNGGNESIKVEKPSNDTLYQVICIGLDGLVSDTSKVKIKVYPIPVPPTVSTDHPIIIEGERTTLKTSNCAGQIHWNTGETGQVLQVNPNKNTTYSATCTVWQCTSAPATISIRVRPKPLLITDGKTTDYHLTDTLCIQKQLSILVQNQCNGTIQWSNGQTGKSLIINALQDTSYQVWCVNADKEQSDESSIQIHVLPYSISDVVLYPNPTSGKLFIQSKGCVEGAKLRLFTQRGELLYEGNEHHYYLDSLVLDLYHLPSAEYILHISGIEGTRPVTLKKRVIKTNN